MHSRRKVEFAEEDGGLELALSACSVATLGATVTELGGGTSLDEPEAPRLLGKGGVPCESLHDDDIHLTR